MNASEGARARRTGTEPSNELRPTEERGEDWGPLLEEAQRSATRYGRGLEPSVLEDIAQEVLTRFLEVHSRGQRIERPMAWVERAARLVALETRVAMARSGSLVGAETGDAAALAEVADDPALDPATVAELEDLSEAAPALFRRLPPPCREIAWHRYRFQRTEREVAAFLNDWRGVGEDRAHQLVALTNQLLRAIGEGKAPRCVWPAGWSKKNPWRITPPPLDSL